MKKKSLIASLALVLGAGLSCDQNPLEPATTGSISIQLLAPSGASFASVVAGTTSDLTPVEDAVASIALTSARVTVTGTTGAGAPFTKTATTSTATGSNFNLTVDQIPPGTYTVRVEGLANGAVAHFGETTGVTVTAGNNTPASVSFPVFQPQLPAAASEDTSDVLRFTVAWNPVSSATGYIVEWSQSSNMSGASSKSVTGATTTDVTVTAEGKYFFTVKAVNAAVTGGGLASAPASVFVFQGVATVTVSPPAPTIAVGATQQMAAEGRDADNGVVAGVTWFWASSNHTVATVNQSGLVTAVAPGTATITAVGKGMPGSTNLTVAAAPIGPANKLAFVSSPANAIAGATLSEVRVAVQTAAGQTVITDNATLVQISIGTNVGGGTLSGTTTATAVNGIATFSNLSINKTGTGYVLAAAANALTGGVGSPFNITHAAMHHLSFSVQPTNAIAGEALSPAVQVEVRDQFENIVTSSRDAITIAIGTNPGAGTLAGTKVVNAINGIASFNGIWIDKVGSGYTLNGTMTGGPTAAASTTFQIDPAAAARLAFSTQPPASIEGNSSFTTQVRVTDAFGNTVPTATNPITLEVGRRALFGTNARLLGTPTMAAVAGVATFANLRVDLAGAGYTLNARSGSLQTAGSDEFSVRLTFAQVDAGAAHTCAITINSSAYCWGQNTSGQLGLGTFATDSVPRLVSGGFAWATMSAGSSYTCGITTTDVLYCWGTNGNGQIGIGSLGGSFAEPQLIAAPAGLSFKSVVAGLATTCATTVTTASGAAAGAYCWGYNGEYTVGDGTNTQANSPTLVAGGLAFKKISLGDFTACGIATTDLAYCWGYNGEGAVAVNDAVTPKPTPQLVNGSTAFAEVDLGSGHSCFREVHVPVDIFCSGRGTSGQIGNSANNTVFDETGITSQLPWIAVAAGGNSTCMLDDTGAAYCVGSGGSGQLGNSALTNQNVRQPVTGGRAYTRISVGANHACALTAAGQVWCWGAQSVGRLGNGSIAGVSRSEPQAVIQQ